MSRRCEIIEAGGRWSVEFDEIELGHDLIYMSVTNASGITSAVRMTVVEAAKLWAAVHGRMEEAWQRKKAEQKDGE